MKKKIFVIGLVLTLMVGIFAGSFFATEPAVAADTAQAQNSITVQGASSVTVTPTIAYVNIGVTTFNKDAAVAQTDNAKKMDQVYKALANLGIAKDKIKTVSYYITPRYDYKENTTTLAGYDVTNGIEVTVTDLTKVSKVLDMTVQQGVNQASSISFGISEQQRETVYLQALTKAVANAKAKASALATASGVSISKPSQIIEGSSGSVVTPYYSAVDMVKAEGVSTPISAGELKVEANVTLVYNY